jgi:hypothetical protein
MDQPDDVVQLLREIRDMQRDGQVEHRRYSKEVLELNRAAAEEAKKQYREQITASRSFTWAMYILIALCLSANLWILVRLSGQK